MNGTEKKILLVEDEPIAQALYQSRLQREGFKISFAEDGEVALNALAKDRPDLVVLDLMLPKVNGTEVLKHIRTQDQLKTMPVLVISNAYMTELSQKAMESGATRGMLKTECTPARLVETVREMLGFRSAFDVTDRPVDDAKQAEEFAAAAEAAMADELLLKETRDEFIQKAPGEVSKIRECCLAYIKTAATPAGEQPLKNLYQLVRFFATRAGLSGCVRIALLASAFEALLFEAVFKPGKATPSVSQTIAQAVDCLERLAQNKDTGTSEIIPKAKILVVDDDAVCNFAMVAALKRAHFEPISTEDPARAIEMAQTGKYDVVFLDINMPGMNGFQVCERLRGMPEYRDTPVIFISSYGDFQNRAQSILSGGNDLIPKPVVPAELVLKTTIRLLQPQSSGDKATATAAPRPQNGNGHSLSTMASFDVAPAPMAPPSLSETGGVRPNSEPPAIPALKMSAPENRIAPPKLPEPPAPAETNALPSLKMQTDSPEPPKSAAPVVPPPVPKPVEQSVPPAPALHLASEAKPVEKPVEAKPIEPKVETIKIEAEAKPEPAQKPAEPKVELPKAELPPSRPAPSPELPISQRSTEPNKTITMETKTKPTFDEAARGVARIIFGDENITDMNVRLTRIALERYNVPGTQNIAEIARGVAQIIFGEENLSEMNVRLTRIALESYNITEVLGASNGSKPANGVPNLVAA
jgi:DNA-binding response OmpR family regulator